MEARQNGYDEGILLDSTGMVSEGAGENIFMVKDGNLYTPPLSSSILDGITRDAVIKIAESLKLDVVETKIPREQLYNADELLFTGTAVEITRIRSVYTITIGAGTKGPVNAEIQKAFFVLFAHNIEDKNFPTSACGGFNCNKYNLFVVSPLYITKTHILKLKAAGQPTMSLKHI